MKNTSNPQAGFCRRFLALALAVFLLLGMVPVGAYAQDGGGSQETQGDTATTAPVETPDVQEQLNAMLEGLKVYIDKTPFFQEDLEALNAGLEQAGKFCEDNGITGLTEEQQTLWNMLAQATMRQLDASYAAKRVTVQTLADGSTQEVVAYYATLQDALGIVEVAEADVVSEAVTVTLLKNIAESGIVINSNVTLDLGGYTLTGSDPEGRYSDFFVVDGGNVTISGGAIVGASDYECLMSAWGCNLTLTGVTLQHNNPDMYSSALECDNCSVVLNGGTKVNAPEGHYAMDIYTSTLSLTNAAVNGSIYLYGDSETQTAQLTIQTGTTIQGELTVDNNYITATTVDKAIVAPPSGYEWKRNEGETVYTLCQESEYAAILSGYGDADGEYQSVTDVLDVLQKDQPETAPVIKLLKNTTGGPLSISFPLILDLNGYTYTLESNRGNSSVISIWNENVAIQNGTLTSQSLEAPLV